MKKVVFLVTVIALLSLSACRKKTCPAYSQTTNTNTALHV